MLVLDTEAGLKGMVTGVGGLLLLRDAGVAEILAIIVGVHGTVGNGLTQRN